MQALLRHSGLLILADRGVLFHQDETLARAILAEETLVDGVLCAPGEEIEFHRGGRLASATLACDALVRGFPARAGSPLGFHPDGSVGNALTASSVHVDGVELGSGARLTIGADGRLQESWRILSVDTELHGIPCSARFPVWSWSDGSLSCLHLAQPCMIEGRRLAWETEVLLERDGGLRAARRRRYPRGAVAPWRVFGADESLLLAGAE
ncbi:MAG: hypothetical protein O3A20_00645 [Planctomycetota bacterium]|nr:hypothetical protein [Planctomycetota bacterium]